MTHTIGRVHIATPRRPAVPHPPRKSMRTVIGWVAVLIGLVTAVTLALVAITSETTPPRIETEQTAANNSRAGVPMSADAAERWLAGRTGVPLGVPGSADAAERWLAGTGSAPVGVPPSADGAERWLGGDHE